MNHIIAAPQHNPATILHDQYRVTEVVHRFEADEATLVGLDNARSAITVCVRDASGLMASLRLNSLVKASIDFNCHENHEYADGTLRRIEVAAPRYGVYCIPFSAFNQKTRFAVVRLSRLIDRLSCEPLADCLGAVLGDPAVSTDYFARPVSLLGRNVISGGMTTRAIAQAEIAMERAATLKRPPVVGEVAAAAALLRPVVGEGIDPEASAILNRSLNSLRAADAEINAQLIAWMRTK